MTDLETRLRADSHSWQTQLHEAEGRALMPQQSRHPDAKRRGWAPALAAAGVAAVAMVAILTAQAVSSPRSNPAPAQLAPAASSTTGQKPTAAPGHPVIGVAFAFELTTHCGIDEARVGSVYFEAERPLIVGAGNPPAGWANPFQRGTMTLTSASAAVFRDPAGHEVRFLARQGATSFKHLCD